MSRIRRGLPASDGIIPIGHKRVPTINLPPESRGSIKCVSTHAERIDVGELKRLVIEAERLSPPVWSKKGHEYHLNSQYMSRPYHEKLGIGNLCFLYSDDAVENVYEFPIYSKNSKWKNALHKIWKQLGICPSTIIRCVVARLPGNVTIPIHHDTGRWVTVAHRMHVPLVTNESVKFFAGIDDKHMHAYYFKEGAAVELNNHAKHAVVNGSTEARLHLMFDYVDKDVILRPKLVRTVLSEDQKIIRHRRFIEVLGNVTEDTES
eukprot:g2266.t1